MPWYPWLCSTQLRWGWSQWHSLGAGQQPTTETQVGSSDRKAAASTAWRASQASWDAPVSKEQDCQNPLGFLLPSFFPQTPNSFHRLTPTLGKISNEENFPLSCEPKQTVKYTLSKAWAASRNISWCTASNLRIFTEAKQQWQTELDSWELPLGTVGLWQISFINRWAKSLPFRKSAATGSVMSTCGERSLYTSLCSRSGRKFNIFWSTKSDWCKRMLCHVQRHRLTQQHVLSSYSGAQMLPT